MDDKYFTLIISGLFTVIVTLLGIWQTRRTFTDQRQDKSRDALQEQLTAFRVEADQSKREVYAVKEEQRLALMKQDSDCRSAIAKQDERIDRLEGHVQELWDYIDMVMVAVRAQPDTVQRDIFKRLNEDGAKRPRRQFETGGQ